MNSGVKIGFLIRKSQQFCIVIGHIYRWLHRPPDMAAPTLVIEILLLSKTVLLGVTLVLDVVS